MPSTKTITTALVDKARYNLRRLFTGISFLLFGLGSLDLAFLIFPVIMLISPNAEVRRKRIQRTISWHFRLFLKILQGLGIMTLSVKGIEQLRSDRGVLVIANHPTLIVHPQKGLVHLAT